MPFTIEEFHDLVRILEERPEWRVELRRLVLTDELLSLPEQLAELRVHSERRFRELIEAQSRTTAQVTTLSARVAELAEGQTRTDACLAELTEAQAHTEARLAELAQAQVRTEVQITALAQSVRTLTDDMGEVKGFSLEANYRAKVYAYFGRLLRRARALSQDELASLLEDAMDIGTLSAAQAHEIALADIVVRGKRPEDGADVYLVVEVSWGVGPQDVERAIRRATLLTQIGITAIPVVAGKWLTAEAVELARTQQVWQITDGYAIPPESAAPS
ncbi:MAG: hypothetical protein HYZ72_21145 [Deltaproteobacteria bacterium]|nr:hypothetical protein [Deltaproteobacteria bacterium]